jgi:L-alanine-DL-glutamate epimerase-like enolase superfamily enzyme
MTVPDGPGLGVEVDEGKVEALRVTEGKGISYEVTL